MEPSRSAVKIEPMTATSGRDDTPMVESLFTQAAERLKLAAGGQCSVLALTIDMLLPNSERVLEKVIAPAFTLMYQRELSTSLSTSEVTERLNAIIAEPGMGLQPSVHARCVCNNTPAKFMDVSQFHETPVPPSVVLPRLDATSNLTHAQPPLHSCGTHECETKQLLVCDLPVLRDLCRELEGSMDGESSLRGVVLSGDVSRCRTLAHEVCSSQLHGNCFTHVYHVLSVKELESIYDMLKAASKDEPMCALLWVDIGDVESDLSASDVRAPSSHYDPLASRLTSAPATRCLAGRGACS